jgi:SAM-dependent methyltransferase
LAKTSHIAPNRHTAHPFDLKYGTDTAGYLSPNELSGSGPDPQPNDRSSDGLNNGYSAVAPSVFREACRRWHETLPASSARGEAHTFVDAGAGKGRAVLLATEIRFRRVIGVELNKDLAHIAQRNLTRWIRIYRPRAKARVIHQDVMEFPWPRPPLLVFLNNPFDCTLIQQLADKLAIAAERGPELIDLLYVNPGCADTLNRQSHFKLLWDAQIEMDAPDRRADPYGAIADRVACFRHARR